MSVLKPCPFCGSTEIENDDGVGHMGESIIRYGARCENCGASFWHPSVDDKLNWNTRPNEVRLRERIAELEARLAVMSSALRGLVLACAEYKRDPFSASAKTRLEMLTTNANIAISTSPKVLSVLDGHIWPEDTMQFLDMAIWTEEQNGTIPIRAIILEREVGE